MIRLHDKMHVIYDANVIIFYSFPEGKYRIESLTNPAKRLTRFLFNQNSNIIVPQFIVDEIKIKGFYEIINDYFSSIGEASKFGLMRKVRNNFENLLEHENFLVEDYEPSEKLLKSINSAFINFNNLDNIDEYFQRKHTNILNPSEADKKLLLFSKEKKMPYYIG